MLLTVKIKKFHSPEVRQKFRGFTYFRPLSMVLPVARTQCNRKQL